MDAHPSGYPPYGQLSEYYKRISVSCEPDRQKGCAWLINGEPCKKECVLFLFYCKEHKNIPDITRVIHDPLTTPRKRK